MSFRSLFQKLNSGSGFLRRGRHEPLAPPVLKEPERFPYGPFRWKSQLPAGTQYSVVASPNLRTWVPVFQGQAQEAPIEYIDSEAPKFPCRFYRLLTAEVPSENVIGYAAISLPPGFSMIA